MPRARARNCRSSSRRELLQLEDLLPSPDAGPEALYARNVLLDELELAVRQGMRARFGFGPSTDESKGQ